MNTRKKPVESAHPEEPDFPGFDLEVEHPQKGKLKLRLSEPVALILAPGLLVLTIVGGGLWLWHTYKPSGASALPPAETVQPKK